MPATARPYDALVIGGGPAGATAALALARAGLSVLVLERTPFPRFHIGESLLPRNFRLFHELGVADALAAVPQMPKYGVEFAFGDDLRKRMFYFRTGLPNCETETLNVERASFDAVLLDAARKAGAEVREGEAVRRVLRLADGDVAVAADSGEINARWLIDASGQATLIGKHLGIRRVLASQRKVAYFSHFEGVERLPGADDGAPTMVMCDEGWLWVIPIDSTRTSIGLVTDTDTVERAGVAPDRMLAWALARCPHFIRRMAEATGPDTNLVAADFTYRCKPYAGPGYFLVGDAATFINPIFSTGVCLAMMGGVEVANGITAILREGARPGGVRRRYKRFVRQSSSPLFRMVRHYYHHSFRELFLAGEGPFEVHRAVLSLLAGTVFPRPSFAVRWRFEFFTLLMWLNMVLPLAARQEGFSLFADHTEPAGPPGGPPGAVPIGSAP